MVMFSGGVLWRSILRAALAEFDKTFFTIGIMSLWCPYLGLRSDSTAVPSQKALVLCGCLLAQMASVLFVRTSIVMTTGMGSFIIDMVAASVCGILSLKAWYDDSTAPTSKKELNPFAVKEESSRATSTSSQEWNTYATELAPRPREPEVGYGAMPSPDGRPAGGRWERSLPKDVSMPATFATAFGLTLAVVFIVELTGRASHAAQMGVHSRFDLLLGAVVGLLLTDSVAILLAFVVERQTDDRKLLFGVVVSFAILALQTLGGAILNVPGLDTNHLIDEAQP